MGGLVDGRRTRTTAGALLEMSALANQKHRLQQERERWVRRQAEIKARLAAIKEKERRLSKFVKNPRAAPPLKSIPVCEMPKRVRLRGLRY